MTRRMLSTTSLACLLAASAWAADDRAAAISPGTTDGIAVVERCPTFSWSGAAEAEGFELAVYALPRETSDAAGLLDLGGANRVVSRQFAGSARSWTPAGAECLSPERLYAWLVRAGAGGGEWSEPRLFRVEAAGGVDLDELAELVLRKLAERRTGGGPDAALPFTAPPAASDAARMDGLATAASSAPSGGSVPGLTVTTAADDTHSIIANNDATSGFAAGGFFTSDSSEGVGVIGISEFSGVDSGFHRGVEGVTKAPGGVGTAGTATAESGFPIGVLGTVSDSVDGGSGVLGQYQGTGFGSGVVGNTTTGFGGLFRNTGGGDIIAADNDFDFGDFKFIVSNDGSVFADGSFNCGGAIDDGAGTLEEGEIEPCLVDDSPADFAEMLPARPELEPGDLLVVDPDGRLARSTSPFQTSVAGVRSTRPSYIGNNRHRDDPGYAPLAIVGVVPLKVTAENGPIRPGDLLASSSVPGHAMRAGSGSAQGTVVGKALEPHAEGDGSILTLLVLQ